MFLQITIDAHDPAALARFWAQALGYVTSPPGEDGRATMDHYREEMGEAPEFENRLFDPAGAGAPLFFQRVPEDKAGKNRVHLDLYPSGRSSEIPFEERKTEMLLHTERVVGAGATLLRQEIDDEAQEALSVLQDPEGNEFCISV